MDNSAASPIEVLNAAIQSHNPFSKTRIVTEQDVWGKGFPDVPTLNKHASDAVFQAVEQVRTSQSSQEKVTSLAITAQPGVGKSHILSRLRHRLERDGGASFVYASVNNYTDLNLIKYQFQQTLANSLSYTANQGVMQWQEVASAMANEGLKAINADAPSLSPANLLDRFDKVCASWAAKNKSFMNTLSQKVCQTKPNADPYIVRAVLWTLSKIQSAFAIRWLSGEELDKSKADELGLPANYGKTNQDREAEALNTVQQILNLVSYYNPVIICFDEIDVKNNSTDDGLPTEMVIADLVKRLHDTLHQSELGQGVVILTVMLPDTWTQKIKPMSGGTPARLSTHTKGKPIELNFIDSNSMIEIVTLWLKDFYEFRQLKPHDRLYPFEENQLKEYGKKKSTVREALTWCEENFKVYRPALPEDPLERFELAFRELESGLVDYMENNSIIAKALCFGFETLKGQTIEGVLIEEVTTEIKPKAKNNDCINFKVIGTENGKIVKIGIAVIQSSQNELVAGLRRLIDYERFDLTRGCLVRSQAKIETIKKTAQAYKLLEQLVSPQERGGEIADLIEEQIRPLIAVYSVCRKCRNYNLNEEQVLDFISQKQLTFDNPLLREILSDPSGQMPVVDDEDERQLLEDIFNPPTIDNTHESDDLSDLFSEL
ncbi:ATP-binding protein [Microcoleus sp. BR0-C5]|uniref:ATP-binding protein n=1 Tax=Microcoleus sp. BR0-C5 TaxID=2818713 RepID=UPI002FD57F37